MPVNTPLLHYALKAVDIGIACFIASLPVLYFGAMLAAFIEMELCRYCYRKAPHLHDKVLTLFRKFKARKEKNVKEAGNEAAV